MSHAVEFIAQTNGGGGPAIVLLLLYLAILVAVIAGTWKAFEKAGEPGWAAIVPLYNVWVMMRIGGMDEVLYFILLFVPIINIWVYYKVFVGISKAFGQGLGFALGLWFLSFIFWPLLGFGDYQFRGTPA